MKNKILPFCLLPLLFVLTVLSSVSARPFIAQFSPVSAKAGSTVTITGSGFFAGASENVVRFGYAKAEVISASETELKVNVPAGAAYAPITVTTGGLMSTSVLPFTLTFPGSGDIIKPGSLKPKNILLNVLSPILTLTADFNDDGKPDFAVLESGYNNPGRLAVYKNVFTADITGITEQTMIDSGFTPNGNDLSCVAIADFDGDGKLDIACTKNKNAVWVYRNTSSSGSLSFTHGKSFSIPESFGATGCVTVADMSVDGKPDIVAGFGRTTAISILVNISTQGNIDFQANAPYFPTSGYKVDIFHATAGDFDNDGKTDLLITTQYWGDNKPFGVNLFLLKNTSVNGIISLQNNGIIASFATFIAYQTATGNFNNDGNPDFTIKVPGESKFRVFNNIGGGSFANSIDFAVTNANSDVSVTDLDGDGRCEVLLRGTNSILVSKNKSSNGTISFSKEEVFLSENTSFFSVGDINGDGKPDVISTNLNENTISALVNATSPFGEVALCAGGGTTLLSYGTESGYQWQVSTDSGTSFVNIQNNNYYNGVNDAGLVLSNIPSSFYKYKYRCINGASSTGIYTVTFANYWLGSLNSNWDTPANWSCGLVPDKNTDVVVESGNIVVNGNFVCGTLTAKPGVSVTLTGGSTLTVSR